jgi:hypothetical protein
MKIEDATETVLVKVGTDIGSPSCDWMSIESVIEKNYPMIIHKNEWELLKKKVDKMFEVMGSIAHE